MERSIRVSVTRYRASFRLSRKPISPRRATPSCSPSPTVRRVTSRQPAINTGARRSRRSRLRLASISTFCIGLTLYATTVSGRQYCCCCVNGAGLRLAGNIPARRSVANIRRSNAGFMGSWLILVPSPFVLGAGRGGLDSTIVGERILKGLAYLPYRPFRHWGLLVSTTPCAGGDASVKSSTWINWSRATAKAAGWAESSF